MPRLFVAVDVPPVLRQDLSRLRDDTLSARWTPPENYHLTLRFVGDVAEERAERTQGALAEIQGQSFPLRLRRLLVFPSRRKPRVLAAGVEEAPALMALQKAVEEALRRVGVEKEERPFRPHVTLGRFKRADPKRVHAFVRAHAPPDAEAPPISRFHLYESVLRPEGALHRKRATFVLLENA